MAQRVTRGGIWVTQPSGYRVFLPATLPPDPPLELDQSLIRLLSEADQAIARLDGMALNLPNPDLFVAMYVRREAVNSSAIEGTQSTLQDVLTYELEPGKIGIPEDVEEVVNYVRAMNYGLGRLNTLPLSLRLIREIHGQLMEGVRGGTRDPGEFRTVQNWIGPENAGLANATFVPPPVPEMHSSLANFESFLHSDGTYPALIHAAIAHAQFETIHPFLDGNGRVGRLLITLLLVQQGVLSRPLLYLSHYLKLHRGEYYDRLTGIREEGNWEAWIRFFLKGVIDTSTEAAQVSRAILVLKEEHSRIPGFGINEIRLIDYLFQHPVTTIAGVQAALGNVTHATASKAVSKLESVDLLEEMTGKRRDRVYRYAPYIDIFNDQPGYHEEIERLVTMSGNEPSSASTI